MTPLEWKNHILKLQEQVTEEIDEEELNSEAIARELERSILDCVKDKPQPLGVLFSGGVDSTIICYVLQKNNIDFIAATVGFQDLKNPQLITKGFLGCQKVNCKGWSVKRQHIPKRIFSHKTDQKVPDDILQARIIAEKYKFKYVEIMHDYARMEILFQECATLMGKELNNAVNAGVGTVELAGIHAIKEYIPECKFILGGLGSEELFAGYKRHTDATNIQEECWNGLFKMYQRDLLRDWAIAKAHNITWLTPFLDDKLLIRAMRVPASQKIKDGMSKLVVRKAAIKIGLDSDFAMRPKKAAQYGSRTDSALDKLAKKKGFKFKKDYLESLLRP